MNPKRKLAQGVWIDDDGGLHFSVPDLLDYFGWPHDEEHKRFVAESIRTIMGEKIPNVPIQEIECCPNCGVTGMEPHAAWCPIQ